jgi:hypothetical protein
MVTKSVLGLGSLRMRQCQAGTILSLACLVVFCVPIVAQTTNNRESQPNVDQKKLGMVRDTDSIEAERRTFAISAVTSLANEARSYDDLSLRARVLMRAADTLWAVDEVTARSLFRKAWEAAEQADAQDSSAVTKNAPPAIVRSLQRISGRDQRMEVLTLAARRDRALSDEFLGKLKDQLSREANDSAGDVTRRPKDPWLESEQITKQLMLAEHLVSGGQVELGLEIASPVLNEVGAKTIGFLSTLRTKNPAVADQRFGLLLGRAELDPLSDANTVSGLSSYILTPGFYVTYSPDGGARWTQSDRPAVAPEVPAPLRGRFFQTASTILLRPSPPPDQDYSSAGRLGKYMVIKRLLPFFDREAPDIAAGLRAQLAMLQGERTQTAIRDDNSLLTQGLNAGERAGDPREKMQERLDRATSSRERDEIYADTAVALALQGNTRAAEIADKIDDSTRRSKVRQFVDLQLLQRALGKEDLPEVDRLAKTGQFTHAQRVWAYTQAAKLYKDLERTHAAELLAKAAEEAGRINVDTPDRARSLVAVATGFVTIDQVRAWELLAEAIKAANSATEFTGENEQLTFGLLATRSGIKSVNIRAADFALGGLVYALTEIDLIRTADLSKSFKNPAARATATLSMAQAVLNKKASTPPPQTVLNP